MSAFVRDVLLALAACGAYLVAFGVAGTWFPAADETPEGGDGRG